MNIIFNSIATYITSHGPIITLISFYFAYYQWKKASLNKRIHLIKNLRVQLDCLGPWMSSDNEGYNKSLTDEEKFDNVNPFKSIYQTADNQLVNLTTIESITNVPDIVISSVYQLYYDLVRIKHIQSLRDKLVYADISTSLALKQYLQNYLSGNSSKLSFTNFMNTITKSNNEKNLAERLIEYSTTLHCFVIGNPKHGARKHWEILNSWTNEELKPKNEYSFVLITFIAVTAIVSTLIDLKNENLFQYLFWLLIIIFITVFLSWNGKFLYKISSK